LLHAEGVLKEALNRIFEQAATRKVAASSSCMERRSMARRAAFLGCARER
jgi:hypothetical protein